MHRRQYLAAASSLLVAGCSNLRTMITGYERPSGTEPLTGTFEALADSDFWTVEFDSLHSLTTRDNVYVELTEEGGLARITPDGSHEWSVDTDERLTFLVNGGSTVYHKSGPRYDERLVARAVESGDEQWEYDTHGRTLAASESAVFVGEMGDDLTTGAASVVAIEAESGEARWENSLGTHSSAVLTHDLCLVPHWKGSLSAFDATTGERRWQHSHEEDEEALQVVGDTAYLLTKYGVAAYALPGGEELWVQSLAPQLRSMAAAAPDATRTDTIVTGSHKGRLREATLHGLDAETGETEWALKLPGDVQIWRIDRWEGTVAVVGEGILYGFDIASGEEQWRQDLSPASHSHVAGLIDGTLFLIRQTEDTEWNVRSFDVQSGQRRWHNPFTESMAGYGVAGDRFVVGTESGTVYGFPAE